MAQCDHKTEAEYGICNRCQTFAKIALNARLMLLARKRYMDLLLATPEASDEAQYALQDAVKRLESSVDFATQSSLWD